MKRQEDVYHYLYYYKDNKRRITYLKEKIEYLRAKAEKITPTLSSDEPGFSSNNESKVERNALKIIEVETELEEVQKKVDIADAFMGGLKPYYRYIVKSCVVNKVPYKVLAKKEKITIRNITKILNRVFNDKNPEN